jgi:uncharacterized damage-inducible protein DinB
MEMKQYLIETFLFNNDMNKKMLEKIKQLPSQTECIRLFSHLINSQNKWMARIMQDVHSKEMSWWDPVYLFEKLGEEWNKSLTDWVNFLSSKTEGEFFKEVEFSGYDGGRWIAKLSDIALQLNYHSIHHRAQMQSLIRSQGFEPDFIDYIGTKYHKIG